MNRKDYPTQEELQRDFEYRDGFLYRKYSTKNYKEGTRIGYMHTTKQGKWYYKYGTSRYKNQWSQYLIHIFIWIYHNGTIENKNLEIDHINGNGLDNRIENLRLVTSLENNKNKNISKNNMSNITGVIWRKTVKKWISYISYNYKKIHLGSFKTKEEAIEARKKAEKKYGFHENHGRKVEEIN